MPWNLASFATAFPGRAKLIRGTLDASDVDAYAFSLASGQLLLAALFETPAGEKNDTVLGLFSGTTPPRAGAVDDDAGTGFLSRLAIPIASSGTRRIAVTGFGDTGWNGTHKEAPSALVPYDLVVAAVSNPAPFQEAEGNNTLATANPLPSEGVIGGTLGASDVDYFKIDLEVGDRLAVSVFDLATGTFTPANGERRDAVLGLFTPAGALAAGGTNDDGGPGFMSNILFTVPAGQAGTWKVALTGFGDTAFTGAHKEAAFPYLIVAARERACPNVTALISGITATTGKAYVTANLKGGDFYYIDRTIPGDHTHRGHPDRVRVLAVDQDRERRQDREQHEPAHVHARAGGLGVRRLGHAHGHAAAVALERLHGDGRDRRHLGHRRHAGVPAAAPRLRRGHGGAGRAGRRPWAPCTRCSRGRST